MTGLFFTILVIVAAGFGLRYLRAREIARFRDADMVDFQTFEHLQRPAPDPLAARAEAFAALNPNVVKLKPQETDSDKAGRAADASESSELPDPSLFVRKTSAFDEVTRNLVYRLGQILPNHLTMIRDVPLAEFVRVEKANDAVAASANASAYKLSVTKIDYLICNLPSLDPVCGIALKDGQHAQEFIKGVFSDIGMPLLQFPATASLSEVELRDQLDPILLNQESRSCPKCKEPMTIRRVVKGAKAGRIYWVCTQFPGCKGVIQA